MNRAEMIERIQRVAGFDDHDDLALTLWQSTAILDAILPQVTTVEELMAVPPGSVLLDCDGEPMHKISTYTLTAESGEAWTVEEAAEDAAPLTVVWRPS